MGKIKNRWSFLRKKGNKKIYKNFSKSTHFHTKIVQGNRITYLGKKGNRTIGKVFRNGKLIKRFINNKNAGAGIALLIILVILGVIVYCFYVSGMLDAVIGTLVEIFSFKWLFN